MEPEAKNSRGDDDERHAIQSEYLVLQSCQVPILCKYSSPHEQDDVATRDTNVGEDI